MTPSPQLPTHGHSDEKPIGKVRTAALLAHALTGPGILSFPWIIAQLGLILGPIMTVLFSIVACLTSLLLAYCSRSGGSRNHDYINTAKSSLGGKKSIIFNIVIFVFFFGVVMEFMEASCTSMSAICWSSNCSNSTAGEINHKLYNLSMFLFGIIQIVLSQLPDVNEYWIVIIAKIVLYFIYSMIPIGLSIAKMEETGKFSGSLTGINSASTVSATMIWRRFDALRMIGFTYSFSISVFAIQDTIKSSPTEANTMEKALITGIGTATIFYLISGCLGHGAFGDLVPANILTAFGSHKPNLLIDVAHAAIFMHLTVSYQGYCQPLFLFIEDRILERFPDSIFINKEINVPIRGIQSYNLNFFRLVWRSIFVMITIVISKFVPYSSDAVGLIKALGFWLLSVYFPIEMYFTVKPIQKWSRVWVSLQILKFCVLIITMATVAGCIAEIILDFKP